LSQVPYAGPDSPFGHPLANPFQGIHHVYANDKALEGLKHGDYPDGAVLVFDLLDYQEKDHALTEGKRRAR